jgi:acetyl esterase/lipase
MIAEVDSFLDDSVDMHHRLKRLGVTTSLHVCPHTPHGFLGMGKLFAEVHTRALTLHFESHGLSLLVFLSG